jgi:hypothetical protein
VPDGGHTGARRRVPDGGWVSGGGPTAGLGGGPTGDYTLSCTLTTSRLNCQRRHGFKHKKIMKSREEFFLTHQQTAPSDFATHSSNIQSASLLLLPKNNLDCNSKLLARTVDSGIPNLAVLLIRPTSLRCSRTETRMFFSSVLLFGNVY